MWQYADVETVATRRPEVNSSAAAASSSLLQQGGGPELTFPCELFVDLVECHDPEPMLLGSGSFGQAWLVKSLMSHRAEVMKLFFTERRDGFAYYRDLVDPLVGDPWKEDVTAARHECELGKQFQYRDPVDPDEPIDAGSTRIMSCLYHNFDSKMAAEPLYLLLAYSGETELDDFLDDMVARGLMTFDLFRSIFKQLLEALAFLQKDDEPFLHHDLKMENIMVKTSYDPVGNPVYTIKLIDLGAMTRVTYGDGYKSLCAITPSTPLIAPPEWCHFNPKCKEGQNYDERYPTAFDMWSVGSIWLAMVTGFETMGFLSHVDFLWCKAVKTDWCASYVSPRREVHSSHGHHRDHLRGARAKVQGNLRHQKHQWAHSNMDLSQQGNLRHQKHLWAHSNMDLSQQANVGHQKHLWDHVNKEQQQRRKGDFSSNWDLRSGEAQQLQQHKSTFSSNWDLPSEEAQQLQQHKSTFSSNWDLPSEEADPQRLQRHRWARSNMNLSPEADPQRLEKHRWARSSLDLSPEETDRRRSDPLVEQRNETDWGSQAEETVRRQADPRQLSPPTSSVWELSSLQHDGPDEEKRQEALRLAQEKVQMQVTAAMRRNKEKREAKVKEQVNAVFMMNQQRKKEALKRQGAVDMPWPRETSLLQVEGKSAVPGKFSRVGEFKPFPDDDDDDNDDEIAKDRAPPQGFMRRLPRRKGVQRRLKKVQVVDDIPEIPQTLVTENFEAPPVKVDMYGKPPLPSDPQGERQRQRRNEVRPRSEEMHINVDKYGTPLPPSGPQGERQRQRRNEVRPRSEELHIKVDEHGTPLPPSGPQEDGHRRQRKYERHSEEERRRLQSRSPGRGNDAHQERGKRPSRSPGRGGYAHEAKSGQQQPFPRKMSQEVCQEELRMCKFPVVEYLPFAPQVAHPKVEHVVKQPRFLVGVMKFNLDRNDRTRAEILKKLLDDEDGRRFFHEMQRTLHVHPRERRTARYFLDLPFMVNTVAPLDPAIETKKEASAEEIFRRVKEQKEAKAARKDAKAQGESARRAQDREWEQLAAGVKSTGV